MQLVPWSAELAHMLAPLFAPDCPIPIRLWAVLDGTIGGRIVVDRPADPAVALVQETTERTVYIGGRPTRQQLAAGFHLLRAAREVVVCLWPGDPLQALLPDAPSYTGSAIDFTDRSPGVDLERLGVVPAGYELRPIDATLMPSLEGFDYYVSMFGDVERALDLTLGYCLLDGAEVVSESIAGPITRGIAELGVGTAEAYRRRGLGTVVAARTIQACEAQGLQAFWNAAEQNEPSVALARRLGFQTEQPFVVLSWAAGT